MSKKKGLLGPDGKPLDVAKYRPKPEPVAPAPKPTALYRAGSSFAEAVRSMTLYIDGSSAPFFEFNYRDKFDKPALRTAVERDLAAIHEALPEDWQGKVEVEPVPPELTDTYAVAHESARRKCGHENSHSTLHSRRERQCEDCGRYFTRKEWYES